MALKRTTPLKANTELKRKAPMPRSAKKPAKKKPRKPKTGDWKRWNDELFAKIVRSRGKCFKCGTTYRLQCSHIVSRSYLATRWDEDNALAACVSCHHGQHMRPLENEADLLRRGIPLEALKAKALTHERPDYVETLQRLVERAEQLDIDVAKFKKHLPPST